ncbi:MAG TPA: glycine oxidase ThiO [Jatrophihabitantaceae bacterium]|nr:glycine oxidase ThiO [Jatrophihabitantaceae bacterium]
MQRNSDVLVVGAGVIGAAIGWRCAQRGLSVTLVDPDPGRGAWHTAAGMLSPTTELHYGEEPLFHLGRASLASYPQFCAELVEQTGIDPEFWECGTLSTAWDAADLATLRQLLEFGHSLGADAELVAAADLRALEPALAPGLTGGMLAHDHQVDPRLLHAALLAAADTCGAVITVGTARVRVSDDRAVGVELDDGTFVSAATVVLAAGAWSGALDEIPESARPKVRPVKGQVLRLRPSRPVLGRVVRALIKGVPVYLVPRRNGDVLVGASLEEVGFDVRPRAGAVYELLRDAQTAVPEFADAELVDVSTGLRPGSPDNAPLVGPSPIPGLVYATGHYRNGILLTPITADGIAAYLADGELPEALQPFSPARFATEVTT